MSHFPAVGESSFQSTYNAREEMAKRPPPPLCLILSTVQHRILCLAGAWKVVPAHKNMLAIGHLWQTLYEYLVQCLNQLNVTLRVSRDPRQSFVQISTLLGTEVVIPVHQ